MNLIQMPGLRLPSLGNLLERSKFYSVRRGSNVYSRSPNIAFGCVWNMVFLVFRWPKIWVPHLERKIKGMFQKKIVWKMNFLLNLAKNMSSWRRLVSRCGVPAPKDGTPGFGPMAHGIFMTTPGLGTCLEAWLTDGFPPFAITNILRLDG